MAKEQKMSYERDLQAAFYHHKQNEDSRCYPQSYKRSI